MIKMIKGTYGLMVGGVVQAMTKNSAPFSLPESREAELIAAGVAEKVEKPDGQYDGMKMAELRKTAAARGVDVSAAKSKREVIAALEAADKADEGAPDTEAEAQA